MTGTAFARKLAAIVVADIVGYSRMMEADESATMTRLKRLRAELVEPKIAEFRGRIVKTTGDGWLAEFASVTDALQCHLEIQRSMPLRNAGVRAEQQLHLRVGVNLGEIIFEGEDIYGAGVNIAARLESLARPGGICVSGAVREQVRSSTDLDFEDVGEQSVKNIIQPVRAYHLGTGAEADAAASAALLAPPVRAAAPTLTNLPPQRTSFIGRQKELAECMRLLGDTRLLTLTGVGGSGKTRLALRLAETILGTYADGVWFIDLAPLESDAVLAQVVARTLDAKGAPGESLEAAIVSCLERKRVLLLLDNCEHLLGRVAELADRLLDSLPELRLLVTSREGLGLDGERLYAVRSLRFPRPGEEDTPGARPSTEAVELFVARVRDLDPEFALDGANVRSVAEICRRLDGIPLAIELAAARTNALSVEQIARMLDDRFRLLTGGHRKALERHRTLRATVQWSFDHLAPDEQALFVTLAVFSGGWTLDAAARVTGSDEFQTLDGLGALIGKSMAVAERGAGTEVRYRLLETLRQFGLELLASFGRAEAVRAAHLSCFAGLVQDMEAELSVAFPLAAVNRIEADIDNVRAALTWGFQSDPPTAVRMVRRLARLWLTAGYYEEGLRWYAQTLELGDAVAPEDRADALARSGRLHMQQGRHEEALRFHEETVAIQRARGDRAAIAAGLVSCCAIHTYRGRYDEARAAHEEARAIYAGLDDREGAARLENAMGLGAYLRGDFAEARRRFEASREILGPEHAGNQARIQVALGNLGLVDIAEGNAAAARTHLRACLAINRRIRNLYGIANFLPALAEAFRLDGETATAARLMGATEALLDQIGAALEALERSVYDHAVAALRTAMGDDAFERACRDGRSMTWDDAIALVGA